MSAAGIRYTEDLAAVEPVDLEGFWEGWPVPPTPERHLAALRGSEVAIVAMDETSGRVVGFVTAVGDGTLAASIPFLEVLPGYRGHGIGRELVRRALDRLAGRYSIDLVCDEDLVPFYEPLGFSRLTAMAIRDRSALLDDGPMGGER
jgi:ribosomal protein S18 acetylase RimI-like enzyme